MSVSSERVGKNKTKRRKKEEKKRTNAAQSSAALYNEKTRDALQERKEVTTRKEGYSHVIFYLFFPFSCFVFVTVFVISGHGL